MTFLLWALSGGPALAGAALLAAGMRRWRGAERAAAAVAVFVATGTLGTAIALVITRPRASAPFLSGLRAGLGVDGLSAALVITVAAVTLLVLLYAKAEMGAPEHEARARFFGLMLLFSAAMQLTVTATTLPLLLVGWELMGATSYALIGFWWTDERRVHSATTAFLTTRSADLGLYIAAGAAVAGVHVAGRGDLASLAGASPGWRDVIAAGVLVAAAGKSAQLPFSFWLSRAMDGPSPVSALLHSATMVAAGGYLLLRMAPTLHAAGWAAPTAAWLGAVTAVLLGLVALVQPDLKQMLAASTCAQVGFMVLAAGSGAVAGGTIHLVGHAATKALLFCVAGVWLSALGTKQLGALRGAVRRWRSVGVLFTIGTLGLAGIPPLALWATKDAALSGAARSDVPLYMVGLVGAALSAAYSARALVYLWSQVPVDADAGYDTEKRGSRRVTVAMTAPLTVLAVFAVALGALGYPPLEDRVRRGIAGASEAGASVNGLLTSAAIAVLVAGAVGWAVHAGVRVPLAGMQRAARDWWRLERTAELLIVRPTLALGRGAAWVDEHVVDAAVAGFAVAAMTTARAVSRVAEVGVDEVVNAVGRSARHLGRLARRPQTGQLHQYYAQAAAGLAAAVVLLLIVR